MKEHDGLRDAALRAGRARGDAHLQPPRPAQRGQPHDERRAASRLAALSRRRGGVRARDHRRRARRPSAPAGTCRTRRISTRSATTTTYRVSLYNSPGECGYTRKADIFKPVIAAVNGYAFAAGPRDRAAGRHPHRGRERGVRRARAALEHRRRRRHDGAAAARRRVRQGDGAGDHRPADRRARRRSGSGSSTRSCRAAGALERAQELAREIAALPAGRDPQRQGEHHARRRAHARGTAAHRGRDGDLDVHAPRSRTRSGRRRSRRAT